jgi:putative ABC transport system substrate-binding protein
MKTLSKIIFPLLVLFGFSSHQSMAQLAPLPPSAPVVLGDWLKISEEAAQSWVIKPDADSQFSASLQAKHAGHAMADKKILFLYPRASLAYNTAISKILTVYAQKGVAAKVRAINFQNQAALGHQAMQAAEKEKFDLVFAMGSESVSFVHQFYKNGKIPIVTVCAKDPVLMGITPSYTEGSNTKIAFTSLNMPVDVQMSYLLQIKPKLINIAIMVDKKNSSAMQTQAIPLETIAKSRGINVQWVKIEGPETADELLAQNIPLAIAEMKKTDAALSDSIFWITGSTAIFSRIGVINRYTENVAVLSAVPDVVRPGDDSAVMSIGIGFEENGYLAALYGFNVINGKASVGSLPVGIVSPPEVAINFKKARQVGLKIPFSLFEKASSVYNGDGQLIRSKGVRVLAEAAVNTQ